VELVILAALAVFGLGVWIGYRAGFARGREAGVFEAARRIAGFVHSRTVE
jgi:hypothetical protein